MSMPVQCKNDQRAILFSRLRTVAVHLCEWAACVYFDSFNLFSLWHGSSNVKRQPALKTWNPIRPIQWWTMHCMCAHLHLRKVHIEIAIQLRIERKRMIFVTWQFASAKRKTPFYDCIEMAIDQFISRADRSKNRFSQYGFNSILPLRSNCNREHPWRNWMLKLTFTVYFCIIVSDGRTVLVCSFDS